MANSTSTPTRLSDVVEELEQQNKTSKSMSKSLNNLDKEFTRFFDELRRAEEGDGREEDIEKAKDQSSSGGARASESKQPGKLRDGLGKIGAGLFGASFLSGLGRRGIMAGLGTIFADEIGNWFESRTGIDGIGDTIERSLTLGSLGVLFGPKMGIIGLVLGALATDKNLEKLGTLFDSLGTRWNEDIKPALDKLGVGAALEKFGTGLANFVGHGLDGLIALVNGDWEGLSKNWGSALGTLGLFAALIAPKSAFRLLLGTLAGGLGVLTGLNSAKSQADMKSTANQTAAATGQPKPTHGQRASIRGGRGTAVFNAETKRWHDPNNKNRMVSASKLEKYQSPKMPPRMGAFLKGAGAIAKRIPAIGYMLGANELYGVLSGDGSTAEKAKAVTKIFSGLGGSALGALVGSLAGPLGTFTGGLLGFFAGEQLAEVVANWLMGIAPPPAPAGSSITVGGTGKMVTTGQLDMSQFDYVGGALMRKPEFANSNKSPYQMVPATTAQRLSSAAAATDEAMGMVISAPTTNINASSSSNQNLIQGGNRANDEADRLLHTFAFGVD